MRKGQDNLSLSFKELWANKSLSLFLYFICIKSISKGKELVCEKPSLIFQSFLLYCRTMKNFSPPRESFVRFMGAVELTPKNWIKAFPKQGRFGWVAIIY